MEELYKEELVREADRNVDLTLRSYKDEFNRMQDRITDGLLYCLKKSGGKLEYQVNELSRQNELLCADIAYIHKTGVGYELENAKRQQAYEEAKAKWRNWSTEPPICARWRQPIIEIEMDSEQSIKRNKNYEPIIYPFNHRTACH